MSNIQRMKPNEAWDYLSENSDAVLLDVRSTVEFTHVGRPVGAIHIPWQEAPSWTLNANFIEDVSQRVPEKSTPVLLLCRSGQRSMQAAVALAFDGYTNLTNIDEGFEGGLDENKHRGNLGGWRFHGLPWEQS